MNHYFTNNENLKSEINIYKCTINKKAFTFKTDNGVFSKKGLDFGTRTLLESIPELKGDILDLGCGYGPIGIYLASNANVDMSDVNERSLRLARENAILNNVTVNAFVSDGFVAINKKYDYIVTNPPIRVGKTKLYELLFGAGEHLKENGAVYLVVSKDQGAKSLEKDLSKEYNVEVINKNKGFHIIKLEKRLTD